MVNSTIAFNQASGLGTYSCGVVVLHSTIYGNASSGVVLGSFDGSHLRMVTNSVIAGQGGEDCGTVDGTVTFDHCLDTDGTCGLGAGSLPMTDPLLLPLRYWGGLTPTMYPMPVTSPVIDVANGTACYVTDQRGEVRGGDGNGDGVSGCDIGAVEVGDLLFFDGFEDGTTDSW